MKLAFATPTPEVTVPVPVALFSGSFSERLRKASHLGYDGVELMVARPDELDAVVIRREVAGFDLEIAAIASGAVYMVDRLTLLASEPEVSRSAVARLDELILFAAATGSPLVTIGGFRGRLATAGDGARESLVQILSSAAGHAADHGVRLALEPLNRYETDIVRTTDEALTFLDEVGSPHLGLLLDTFHVNIEEASMTECFRRAAAAGRLWHVHLGDSNRLPPGKGHIDFAAIAAALSDVGYEGYLSAELLPQPSEDAAGEATISHMRQFIPPEPQV